MGLGSRAFLVNESPANPPRNGLFTATADEAFSIVRAGIKYRF